MTLSGMSRRQAMTAGILAGVGAAMFRSSGAGATAARELPLITRPIPSTGERLAAVGLGTNRYSVSAPDELAARREVLRRLPELGAAVVDTARAYGQSETVIGRLVAEIGNRSQLFLATKTPIRGDVSQGDAVVAESLRRLQTETVDLMQLHNLHGVDELVPVLRGWKDRGRIRYVGVTTSSAFQYERMMTAMRRHPFDFIQVDYSIANRRAAEQVLPLAQERGMAVLVNMPFGGPRGGNLFARLADRALPGWAEEIDAQSWAEVLLKYCISHPAVTCAIPGTTQVRHLEMNLRAARGRLPDAALRRRMEQFWDATA